MLELKDASLTVDGRQILRKLSMMALEGQMTCFTGRPGCGKALLLFSVVIFNKVQRNFMDTV